MAVHVQFASPTHPLQLISAVGFHVDAAGDILANIALTAYASPVALVPVILRVGVGSPLPFHLLHE